ncbi:unannotated protein [freshwater metagenome]|uniref:Unannotated protein n=1 Tax=freshwater metagenome TaxID=449393 RepID=A0A6J6TGF8_9ZZZZ
MAEPLTFEGMSGRLTVLPITLNSASGTSGADAGGVRRAAAAATAPYVYVEPDGVCLMTPFVMA